MLYIYVSDFFPYHISNCSGPVVNVDLWDQAAENFRRKFDESVTTPTILMVTTVNPKRLGGKLSPFVLTYSNTLISVT